MKNFVCPANVKKKWQVERNFARLTIKICNYCRTFIIDLSKHLLLQQFHYLTILLSDYILYI